MPAFSSVPPTPPANKLFKSDPPPAARTKQEEEEEERKKLVHAGPDDKNAQNLTRADLCDILGSLYQSNTVGSTGCSCRHNPAIRRAVWGRVG